MLRNFSKQIAPLIGILIISVGAFFGFGSIFSYLDIGLGAQALTAAFGALFIILSTKFLMDTESASSLKREKDRLIFNQCLEEYKELSACIVKILEDSRITLSEINELRQKHAQLILLGSKNSITASRMFLQNCLNIFDKYISSSAKDYESQTDEIGINLSEFLTEEELTDLWGKAIDFIIQARLGLELDEQDINVDDEKLEFSKFVLRLNKSKKKEVDLIQSARQPLTGGLDEYLQNKKISESDKNVFKSFIDLLEKDCSLKAKYTKSQISFSTKKEGFNNNILYINSIKNNKFQIDFAGKNLVSDDNFWDDLKNMLNELNSEVFLSKTKSQLGKPFKSVKFFVPIDQIKMKKNLIDILNISIDEYIQKFRK